MDKAIAYIKSASDKKKAYENVVAKYGNDLSDRQKEAIKKFVR
jgi:hypothetical protein